MALQKQYFEVKIAGGIDEANDPYLAERPSLVENGRYDFDGSITKRDGTDPVRLGSVNAFGDPYRATPAPPNPPHRHLTTGFETELLQVSDEKLFTQSGALDQPIFRGLVPEYAVTLDGLPTGPQFASSASAAEAAGYVVYVWLDSQPGQPGDVYVCVRDGITRAVVLPPTIISAPYTGTREPTIHRVGSNGVVITFRDSFGESLLGIYTDLTTPPLTWFPASTVLRSDMGLTLPATMDTAVDSFNRLFVAYVDGTTPKVAWASFNAITLAPLLSGTCARLQGAGETYQRVTLAVPASGSTTAYVAFTSETPAAPNKGALYGTRFNTSTLVEIGAATLLESKPLPALRVSSALLNPTNTLIVASYPAIYPRAGIVLTSVTRWSGTTQFSQPTTGSALVASKPISDGNWAFVLVVETGARSYYFCRIWDLSNIASGGIPMRPAGAYGLGQADFPAGGVSAMVPRMDSLPEINFAMAVTVSPPATVDLKSTPTAVFFDTHAPIASALLGRNVHISGGVPSFYDGAILGEIGFVRAPIILDVTTAAGPLAAGTYSFIATYEYTDAQGQIHRSAPTAAISVTVAVASTITVKVAGLGLTNRQTKDTDYDGTGGTRGSPYSPQIEIVLYRTASLGTVFHRVASGPNVTIPTATFNTSIDLVGSDINDLTLLTRPLLYSTGGVLDNISPPSSTLALTHKNRLYLAGTYDPKRIWFSKSFTEGEAAAFNELMTFSVDDGGPVTALGSVDDKLIVFKDTSIYAVFGDGPNDVGQGSDLSLPQKVASDVGCAQPHSVITTSLGLFFAASKGIYLLTRGLELTFIGKEVETITDQFPAVTAATIDGDHAEIRFELTNGSSGCRIAYDYLAKAWTKATIGGSIHPAASAVQWRGQYTWIASANGSIYQETANDSAFDNTGAAQLAPTMRVVSGWIKPAGVQGFDRVWRVGVLGRTEAPQHSVTIELGVDYKTPFIQTATFPSTLWTSGEPEQAIVHVARQKCESIRVAVSDANIASINGRTLTIASLALTVGIKGGIERKLPATNRG